MKPLIKTLCSLYNNVSPSRREKLRIANSSLNYAAINNYLRTTIEIISSNHSSLLDLNTALSIASANNNSEISSILIYAGANLISSYDALYWSAHNGHVEAVEILLKSGADPNICNPLDAALVNGHEKVTLKLLEHGADPLSVSSQSLEHAKNRKFFNTLNLITHWQQKIQTPLHPEKISTLPTPNNL